MSPYTDIYLDVVFLINFTMDFFILWAAAKLGKLPATFKGLVLGSFIGAGYAVLIFLPALTMLGTFLAKILCSLLMIIVTYKPTSLRWFFKSAAYFYLVSFILGGAVLGSMYLFNSDPLVIETWNGIIVNRVSFETFWLLAGLAVAIILGIWGAAYIRRNLQQGPWLVKAEIELFNTFIETDALVDTGNQLVDPISKEPVMVIEYKKMANVLPPELLTMLENKKIPSLDELIKSFLDPQWATRVRLIPFSSLGNHNGMLIGIKPDLVRIRDGDKVCSNSSAIVAIYHRRLCAQGTYQALVHPDMLCCE